MLQAAVIDFGSLLFSRYLVYANQVGISAVPSVELPPVNREEVSVTLIFFGVWYSQFHHILLVMLLITLRCIVTSSSHCEVLV